MKTLFLFLLLVFSFQLTAQTEADALFTEKINGLLEVENYETIIKITQERGSLTDTHKYLQGVAFFYLEKESKALKLFDEVIAADSTSEGARYYKSYIHYFRGELDIALSTVNDAIKYHDKVADFHLLKGEILYTKGEKETAIQVVRQALSLENCSKKAYSILAEMYQDQNDVDNALKIYVEGMTNVTAESPSYEDIYFNAGLLFYLEKQYEKAHEIFSKLYETRPTPEIASKLIQTHYALGEYEKGNALKPIIYKAWEAGDLVESMNVEFCVDQFDWEDKTVMVYELLDEPEVQLYYKHVFYVVDKEEKLHETVQTEWSIVLELDEHKDVDYVLGRDIFSLKSGERIAHDSYFQYKFKKDFNYPDLKKAVLAILNEDVPPMSFSGHEINSKEIKKWKKKKKRKKNKKPKRA